MKIGLVDADRESGRFSRQKTIFPNIALMKLSSWHKSKGDETEIAIPMMPYDKIYISKVFTDTPDIETIFNCNNVIRGGAGYDLDNKLEYDVEHSYPDYDLYGIKNTAYGFLSRGCPRNCSFAMCPNTKE